MAEAVWAETTEPEHCPLPHSFCQLPPGALSQGQSSAPLESEEACRAGLVEPGEEVRETGEKLGRRRGWGGFPGRLWDRHEVVPCGGAHTVSSTSTHCATITRFSWLDGDRGLVTHSQPQMGGAPNLLRPLHPATWGWLGNGCVQALKAFPSQLSYPGLSYCLRWGRGEVPPKLSRLVAALPVRVPPPRHGPCPHHTCTGPRLTSAQLGAMHTVIDGQ